MGVMMERAQHLPKRGDLFRGDRCAQSHRVASDRCRHRCLPPSGKAVAGETDFAAADQTHPDRSGAGHDYRTVRAAVGPETSSHPVADEKHGRKRMYDPL